MNVPQLLPWRAPFVSVMNRLPSRAQQGLNLLANALQWQPLLVRKTPQASNSGSREASTSSQHAPHSHQQASACARAKHKPVGALAAHPRDPFLANVPLALLGLDEHSKHYRAVSLMSWGQVVSDRCFVSMFAPAPMLLLPSGDSSSSNNKHGIGRRRKRPSTGQHTHDRMHHTPPGVTISSSSGNDKRICIGSSHNDSTYSNSGSSSSSSSNSCCSKGSSSNSNSWHTHQRNQTSASSGWASMSMSPQSPSLPRLACQHNPLQPSAQMLPTHSAQLQTQTTPAGVTIEPIQQSFPQGNQTQQHAVVTPQHAEGPGEIRELEPVLSKVGHAEQTHDRDTRQMPQGGGVEEGQHRTASAQQQQSCVAPQHSASCSSSYSLLPESDDEPVLEFPEDFLAWLRSADELDVLIKGVQVSTVVTKTLTNGAERPYDLMILRFRVQVLLALPKDLDLEDAYAQYKMYEAGDVEVYPVSWFYKEAGPGDEQRWVVKGNLLGLPSFGPSVTFENGCLKEQGSVSESRDHDADETDSIELLPNHKVDVKSAGHMIGHGALMRMPTDRGSLVFGYWAQCPYG